MVKDLQLKVSLTRWFSSQSKYSNLRELSGAVGIPFNTLRGYFSGKPVSGQNLKRLTDVTGLNLGLQEKSNRDRPDNASALDVDAKRRKVYAARLLEDLHFDLARCLSSIPPAQKALGDGARLNSSSLRKRSQLIVALMDAIERNLSSFIEDPEALQILRNTISGSDAGYLSGLLGSISDDRRLRTWQQLTTYKYGSK